jgi:pimeloyl-ACP methyl ester carboxylesterase
MSESPTFIPFDDFGGQGPILHLAHANGYTPASYKQLVSALADHYHVLAMRQRPLWAGSRPEDAPNVQVLVDDLIRFLEQEKLEQIVGIGHSMGAVITMLAARQRPRLFRALVLIEPVFLMPALIAAITAQPPTLTPDDIPVIRAARNRRQTWPSREEAFAHFRPKKVFADWPDEALWDYIWHGMHKNEAGDIQISYSVEWEVHIYNLMLVDIWAHLGQARCPTLAVRAENSDTLAPAAWELWRLHQPQATFVEVAGASHLLTMANPRLVADLITDFLKG